jgi:hypothetical protein
MTDDDLTPLQRAQIRESEAVREATNDPRSIARMAELRDATNAVRELLAARRKKVGR